MKLIFKGTVHEFRDSSTTFECFAVTRTVQGREFVATNKYRYLIPVGEYEAEEISNPFGAGPNWIIIKGTQIGANITFILEWAGKAYKEKEIYLIDDKGERIISTKGLYDTLTRIVSKKKKHDK